MMCPRPAPAAFVWIGCLWSIACAAAEPLPADVFATARKSVGYVVRQERRMTAVCVHSSGLFVVGGLQEGWTTGGKLPLVLDSGTPRERTVTCTVENINSDRLFVLLRADEAGEYPPLALGTDDDILPKTETFAIGFPLPPGRPVADPTKLRPQAAASAVTAVVSIEKNSLGPSRLKLSEALDRGHIGGPLLSRTGKAVGIVAETGSSGIGREALPIGMLRRYLGQAIMRLEWPIVTAGHGREPHEFRLTAYLPADPEAVLEPVLVLKDDRGQERRVPMVGKDGTYAVRAVPFPDEPPPDRFRARVVLPDGPREGFVADRDFAFGTRKTSLGKVRRIEFGPIPTVLFRDGATRQGALDGLASLPLQVGEAVQEIPLDRATALELSPAVPRLGISCFCEASYQGRLVGLRGGRIRLRATEGDSLDRLLDWNVGGEHVEPPRAEKPHTRFRIVGTPGDPFTEGKSFDFEGDDVRPYVTPQLGEVKAGAWTVRFRPWYGQSLGVEAYTPAIGPFTDRRNHLLEFAAEGKPKSPPTSGSFRVWEIEFADGKLAKLAVDFVVRPGRDGPPAVGLIRWNSTYE